MELGEYFRAFREYWIVIALVTVFGLAGAYGISQAMPKKYEAEAMLFVKVESESGSLYEKSQFSLQRVKSYPNLVDSPDVLEPVMDELGLDISLSEMRDRVRAINPTETVFLQVIAESASPEEAAKTANLVSERLAAQIRDLEVNTGTESASVLPVVTGPATVPTSPSSPELAVNVALGSLAGLSAGLITALLCWRLDGRVRRISDVRDAVGLPVLAQLPRSRDSASSPQKLGPAPGTAPYRQLLANMQLMLGGEVPSFVLIVPAITNYESEPARAGLAQALADSGRRVCLLEADYCAEPVLGLTTEEKGLSEVLAADMSLTAAMTWVEAGPLHVLAPGDKNHAPTEFAVSHRFAAVAADLMEDFDTVLAQATPFSRPISAAMLASVTREVLLLAAYKSTTRDQLVQTAAELRAVGLHPLGVVMTQVPDRRRSPVMKSWVSSDFIEAANEQDVDSSR